MPVNSSEKIILVEPGPHRIQIGGAILHLPLALLSLAAWLRREGDYKNNIRIVDMRIEELDPAVFKDARIVGITAMTGHQIRYGLQAARLARQINPDVVLVWGGIHPSLLPEQTCRHELVDIVVVGEGEETFREVADAVFAGKEITEIPGTCVKMPDGSIVKSSRRAFIDLNSFPLPSYDLVSMELYHGIEHQFDYQSSRGCPYRCGFCYNTIFSQRKWRGKSADKVVEELLYLREKYNVRNFGLVDDEFFIDIRRVEDIFNGIIERGVKCGIVASCRLDIIRKIPVSSLEVFKKAGLMQIFFGAESGCDETLKDIKKDITTDDIIKSAQKVAKSGIRPILSFMSGFPGETSGRFEETLDIIQKLRNTHRLITVNGIFPFNAYPGTEMYLKAEEKGLLTPETLDEWGNWTFQYKPDYPWIDKKMKQWMQISFYIVRFYYYISRYKDRHKNSYRVYLLNLSVLPLRISARIRWKNKWFGWAFEWHLFAILMKKSFGYL